MNHNQGKLTVKKVLIFKISGGYSDLIHYSSLRVHLSGEMVCFESSPPAPLQRIASFLAMTGSRDWIKI